MPDARRHGLTQGRLWRQFSQDGVEDGPPGPDGARQGLNDYTGWFAGDADMAGTYRGYDGPYPPAHDLREHRYFFRVFALDVASLQLPERFTAADIADTLWWVANLPPHLNINRLEVMPVSQSFAGFQIHREG